MPLPRPAPGTAKWWVVGTVGCVAGPALAIWWGLASTVGQVTWTDLGYEHATDVAQEALLSGRGVAEIVEYRGLLTRAQIDELLSPAAIVNGSRA